MLGRKERRQSELFVAGSLRDLLPDDHVLVRVDQVLDLGWLHEEVAELYDASPAPAAGSSISSSCSTSGPPKEWARIAFISSPPSLDTPG
jgi:hypothetical protein